MMISLLAIGAVVMALVIIALLAMWGANDS
jgi:hypothetical protein